ncbi:hypothetical protein OG713_43480 [Streptomyces sp. NBC_00723]
MALLGPAPACIPFNNIPQFRQRMAGRTFRQWQAEQDARATRRAQPPLAPPDGGSSGASRST